MTIAYLNTKTSFGTETVDHLDSKDFATHKAFRDEKKRLKAEYVMAGGHGDLYWSQRCVKDYK